MNRDYIDLQDFTGEELVALVELTGVMKQAYKARELPDLLHKRTLTMMFLESSLRTRMSFEVAMTSLGGHGLYIRPGDIHLGKREDLKDTATVMARLCDGIVIRSAQYADIEEVAKYSSVPVINGMADDRNHPTQVLCDVFTMYEVSGKLKGLNLAFVGDTSDGFGVIGRDLMLISSKLGINFYCASPKEYMVDGPYLEMIEKNAELSGAAVIVKEEPQEVIAIADFLTCDAMTWYGFEEETEKRLSVFLPKYQITEELLDLAPDHCRFLHCLPAKRGEEVTAGVIDGEQSIVYDQAENRLYAELALCAAFLADERDIDTIKRKTDKGCYDDRIVWLLEQLKEMV
jgi:putrescine carbamoyltransferase